MARRVVPEDRLPGGQAQQEEERHHEIDEEKEHDDHDCRRKNEFADRPVFGTLARDGKPQQHTHDQAHDRNVQEISGAAPAEVKDRSDHSIGKRRDRSDERHVQSDR
jgi:hypothetical protein